ncbi:MAG: luciferase family oxidoreductase, group 1 [Bacteroidetes bacterium]|nr:luciferase family oxidoreductase, group 1 [Bacteroidota bacterium]
MKKIALSVLELAVVKEGGDSRTAIDETVAVAHRAEELDFSRIWLAEHHNSCNIASSATAVLIGHVAGETKKIRVGSGGIMLPNHAPLIVAEQFGTLETLYPGRIDLGLGRAPGTDQQTVKAIRRKNMDAAFNFPDDVKELRRFFGNNDEHTAVRAFPGEGLDIPIWILGSSTDSAYVAAELGLPYAFASHFAPEQLFRAIEIYRSRFRASKQLAKPYVLACVNVIGADTDEEAKRQSSSMQRMFIGILTGERRPLAPPRDIPFAYVQHPQIMQHLSMMMKGTFIGSEETLRRELAAFIEKTQADELMVTCYLYDKEAKLKSLELAWKAVYE